MITTILQNLIQMNYLSTLIQQNLDGSINNINNACNNLEKNKIINEEIHINVSTNAEKIKTISNNTNSNFFKKKVFFFTCKFANCTKRYTTKENLKLHISNFHWNLKPYNCSFCKKNFSHRNGNLIFIS